ncbi:MAG: sulfatase-like hydrolase/transferase [Eubacteriales bacterium]
MIKKDQVENMKKPNIIFIFADDLGYGDLGCYGHSEINTPNIDRLAEKGTRFMQFHVASPVCSPSRAAVITGKYPAKHNIHGHFAKYTLNEEREMPNWLDENCMTIPKMLKDAGYATAHYGKWHLGGGGGMHGHPDAPTPMDYGFDDSRVWNGNGPTWVGTEKWPFAVCNDDDEEFLPHSDMLAVNEAIAFMEEHKEEAFYIDVWLRTPHTPLRVTPEQRAQYASLPEPKQTYYSVVSEADKQVGRLLDRLEALGLEEDTLVLFSSDNGPETFTPDNPLAKWSCGSTSGLRGRKRSLYEGGIRVPFIASWKGKIAENEVDFDSLLSSVDLLPTFADLAGVKLTSDMDLDGEIISEALCNRPYRREKALMWEWLPADRGEESKECPVHAIRKDDYMLLKNPSNNRIELYNIMKDHAQICSVTNAKEELVTEMMEQLDQWTNGLPIASARK